MRDSSSGAAAVRLPREARWKMPAVLVFATALVAPMLPLASAAGAASFFVTNAVELQNAVNSAVLAGGSNTIHMAPGTYHFNTTPSGYFVLHSGNDQTTSITIEGSGASSTFIDGDGGNPLDQPLIDRDGLAPVTIEDVTIQNSGVGGSVTAFRDLTIKNSVVHNNAGGLQDFGGMELDGTTVGPNAAGIDVEAPFSAVNTTISGNQGAALNIDGGGATETLVNVTISGNSGPGLERGDQVVVTNSIIAGNSPDCSDLSSSASSGGHNIEGDGSCSTLLAATGDITADPALGALQDNGGPTPTMALGATSPAVDAGNDASCPATDQRGVARPQGAHCDIGAFELATSTGTTTSVASSLDPSTIGDAVTFTATVSSAAGTPTGSVTFTDAANTLSSCASLALAAGVAMCTTTFSSALAGDVVTAAYNGATGFAPSLANVTQVVHARASTTSLTSSSNPSLTGNAVTLTATVTPVSGGGPSFNGTVTFTDGGASIGCDNVALTAGVASCIVSFSAVASIGHNPITATFDHDSAYSTSTGSIDQQVLPRATITATPSSITADASETSTVDVALFDSLGNPIPGKAVQLVQTGGAGVVITGGVGTTDSSGHTTFGVSGLVPTDALLAALDVTDNLTVGTVHVSLLGPSPALSTVVATPPVVVADQTSASTITVTLIYANGNPVPGKIVHLAVTAGQNVGITPSLQTSDAHGQVSFSAVGSTPTVALLVAHDDTEGIVVGTVQVVFTPVGLGDVSVGSGSGASAASTAPGGAVTVTATGGSAADTVVVGQYSSTPVSGLASSTGAYFDIIVAQPSTYTALTIVDCNLMGGTGVSWWNGTLWQPVNPAATLGAGPCATFTLTSASSPTIAQLTGTVFGTTTVRAPVAVADHYDTGVGVTLRVPAGGVLSNDTLNGATITSHTEPAHGRLTLAANGAFTYEPSRRFEGIDTFTYTLNNGFGSSTAVVTIDVPARADLSVAVVATQPANSSSIVYAVTVTNNGPDAANDVTTVFLVSSDVSITSVSPRPACRIGQLLCWTASTLGPSASVTYQVVVNVAHASRSTITALAVTGATGSLDPVSANNLAVDQRNVGRP